MDAKELFSKVDLNLSQPVFRQLKQLFFNQKADEIKKEHCAMRITEINESKAKAYIKKLRQTLPEAELIEAYFTGNYWVKMKNVDFKINAYCENCFSFYDKTLCSATFYESSGIASLIRKFDAAISLWMSEFQWFCARNKVQIELLERERLLATSDKKSIVENYLKSRICDKLLATRALIPNMFDSEYKEFEKYCQGNETDSNMLKHILIENDYILMENGYYSKELHLNSTNFQNVYRIAIMPHKPEVLVEIDNSIPQWLEESKTLLREFDKREKIEQLNINSVKVLIKNKMRELNFEYRLNQKEQYHYQQSAKPIEYVLEVKLQKGRKLVVTIPPDNIDRVRKILDSIETSINAINSVPMNHRIKFQSVGREDWTKE